MKLSGVADTIPAAGDAWAYENDLDLPALCQAPGFVGCTPPGQLADPGGRTHAIDFDLMIPVTGTFTIMYRFTDTTSTTNPIHMDVPHNQIIGDASTQRSVFLSQATVGN